MYPLSVSALLSQWIDNELSLQFLDEETERTKERLKARETARQKERERVDRQAEFQLGLYSPAAYLELDNTLSHVEIHPHTRSSHTLPPDMYPFSVPHTYTHTQTHTNIHARLAEVKTQSETTTRKLWNKMFEIPSCTHAHTRFLYLSVLHMCTIVPHHVVICRRQAFAQS